MIRCILLASLVALSACEKNISDADDYLKRLENVLDVKANAELIPAPRFPKSRALQTERPKSELSIREFLSLRQCKLHTTIAHRNSLIGKLATPSQLLFNDLDLLAQGPACLQTLGESALATKLTLFLENKEAGLNRTLWHALLAQDENAQLWRIGTMEGSSKPSLNNNAAASLAALANFVEKIQAKDYQFSKLDYDKIENHLGALRSGGGGILLFHHSELINSLNKANSVIQQRLATPLCLNNGPTTNARYFSNIVSEFFIGKVQSHSVKLNRVTEKLLRPYHRLEQSLLESANTTYQEWAAQRNALIERGRSAATSHVLLLQRLYQQCGLSVGGES